MALFKSETRKKTGCASPCGELTSRLHECIGCLRYDSNRISKMRYDDRNRISDGFVARNRLCIYSWDYKGLRSRDTITRAINNDQGVIRVRRRNRDALFRPGREKHVDIIFVTLGTSGSECTCWRRLPRRPPLILSKVRTYPGMLETVLNINSSARKVYSWIAINFQRQVSNAIFPVRDAVAFVGCRYILSQSVSELTVSRSRSRVRKLSWSVHR